MTQEEVIDLIRDSGYGVLATVEGDQPRVRPMMPYLTEDNRILVALLDRSRTIGQIKENPKVEICFVDRKMWYCRIAGEGKISENKDDKQLLWDCIPMLKQYFGSPDDHHFVLLEVKFKGQVEAMSPHQKQPETINLSA